MYDITICTPIYNRAYKILDLYESLKLQSIQNFEWLIIDDGSTDNIESKIDKIKSENVINYKYIKKDNGGKHTAINIGLEFAEGELFFIVDSDDILTKDSIEKIIYNWRQIKKEDRMKFIGVSGNRGYNLNQVIGDGLPSPFIECTAIDLRYHYNINGDKAEAFETEKLKKYKFPEHEGEKFLTEAIIWNRISKDGYLLRWFNDIIYITEYLDDGLTKKYDSLMANNINGTIMYYTELLEFRNKLSAKKEFIAKVELIKYLFINKLNLKDISKILLDVNYSIIMRGYILAQIYNMKKYIKRVIKKND